MKTLLLVVAWCTLLAVSWPLALLALVVWPVVWLISLPLAVVGMGVEAVFVLLKTILYLPAKILGHRGQ